MSLTTDQVEVIKATIPVLEAQGEQITRHFYSKMLTENPEVQNFFNKTHQSSFAQPRALALSLLAYARNIDTLENLADLVERVAQKHTSLMVLPEHYPIVGKYLMMAIGEVLGKDVATPPVVDAWTAAYEALAKILIETEAVLYESAEKATGGWRGYRDFRVAFKNPEAKDVVSIYLKPVDDKEFSEPEPGQYLGFRFKLDSGSVFNRQYSISEVVRDNEPMYRISVKRIPGGVVSKYWHDQLKVGDVVQVSPPSGDFLLKDEDKGKDVVLLAAGIGITPMIPLAQTLAAASGNHKVAFVQSERDPKHRPFGPFVDDLIAKKDNFTYYGFFSDAQEGEQLPPNSERRRITAADLDKILAPLNGPIAIYMTGPPGYMKDMKDTVEKLGRQDIVLRYEYFGPFLA